MTIDIRGVNTHNKGAHLMLLAIAAELAEEFTLAASPNGSTYEERARLGLGQTLILNQAPRLSSHIGNRLPPGLRRSFGLVAHREVSGVLDAAGFAYSDSFSTDRSKREAILAKGWASRSVPFVMLPQAFGPFESAQQAKWSGQLIGAADLVFARDRRSLAFVRTLRPSANAKLAPDFTIGLSTAATPSPIPGEFAAIVPNSKMITHAGLSQSTYVESLVSAARSARSIGLTPVVVIHEFSDIALGRKIAAGAGCETFQHPDPIVLKKALGDARVAVASRFHAIVGAVSQSTPVLALGWSHKYAELLNDFEVGEWLATPEDNLGHMLQSAVQSSSSVARMEAAGTRLKEDNAVMWASVRGVLRA